MDYPSIQVEDTDQTYFDLVVEDEEYKKLEDTKNIHVT